jgi:hypothetical protein
MTNHDTRPIACIRTYENFTIKWDRGSKWSGYSTYEEAQRTLHSSTDGGQIHSRRWEVEVPVGMEDIYKPGVAERPTS